MFFLFQYMEHCSSSLTSIQQNIFHCFKCDFKCIKKGDWNRHLLTKKHSCEISETNITLSISEKNPTNTCSCGEKFNSRTTLWRHKKKCNQLPKNIQTAEENANNLVIKLLSQNNDLQQLLIEQSKQIAEFAKSSNFVTNNTTNNNTTNNNHFNLQFFLNDTCKDALNLVDFVESLQVQLKDLEETARIGYSDGVSRIFINGLNELDVNMRPIHCSDAKRDILYIKDQDEWTKEDTNKTRLSKAIKTITNKNIKQIFEWQKKYPDYKDPESKQSDRYMEMICNTMSGSTNEEQQQNLNKIIKKITKEVIIDKNIIKI